MRCTPLSGIHTHRYWHVGQFQWYVQPHPPPPPLSLSLSLSLSLHKHIHIYTHWCALIRLKTKLFYAVYIKVPFWLYTIKDLLITELILTTIFILSLSHVQNYIFFSWKHIFDADIYINKYVLSALFNCIFIYS